MLVLFQLFDFLKQAIITYAILVFAGLFVTFKFDLKTAIIVVDAITIGFVTFNLIPVYILIVLILINVIIFGYDNTGDL